MNEEQMKYVANLMSQDLEKDQEIQRLNNIIEKAIEYINHENFKRTILVGVSTKKYTKNILDNVLNILNGGQGE